MGTEPSPKNVLHRRDFNIPGHAHELTFSCYQRYEFLKSERTCLWLAEAMEKARKAYRFELWAYVFMPNHVHLIIRPTDGSYRLGAIRTAIKLPVAKRAIQFLEQQKSSWLPRITRKRGHRTERLFWQSGGGYDRNINSSLTLLKMIDYVHLNPVRRGLCSQASDWRWSSASAFVGLESPLRTDPIPSEWLADA